MIPDMLPRTSSVARVIPVICFASVLVAVAGCSGGSSPGGGGSGGSGLESALSRVADTASTRSSVSYDDTAALVRLAGTNPASTKGFAQLRGWGVPSVAENIDTVPVGVGFNLYGEDYSISVGEPPESESLMAGGQSASQITGHLTGLGWKRSGGAGKLVGPPPLAASSSVGELAIGAAQVQLTGSDAVFGYSGANLSLIGTPNGATLASDPLIGALAQCLGNVVAADLFSGGYLGGKKPAGVAVGISQPASNTATPQAVVCVSWSTQAAATTYAADVRRALSSVDPVEDEPYSDSLTHATVTTVGGSQHVVEWQADTPKSAQTAFLMVEDIGLPALPDCQKLTALQAAQVIGCT
jgi:hypothetical protein